MRACMYVHTTHLHAQTLHIQAQRHTGTLGRTWAWKSTLRRFLIIKRRPRITWRIESSRTNTVNNFINTGSSPNKLTASRYLKSAPARPVNPDTFATWEMLYILHTSDINVADMLQEIVHTHCRYAVCCIHACCMPCVCWIMCCVGTYLCYHRATKRWELVQKKDLEAPTHLSVCMSIRMPIPSCTYCLYGCTYTCLYTLSVDACQYTCPYICLCTSLCARLGTYLCKFVYMSVQMSVFKSMRTLLHVLMYISVHMSMHVSVSMCTSVCSKLRSELMSVRMCMHVSILMSVHVYTLVCTHIFVLVYAHVYTHPYTHII